MLPDNYIDALIDATADHSDPIQHERSQRYRRSLLVTRDEVLTMLSMLDGNRPAENAIAFFKAKWGLD